MYLQGTTEAVRVCLSFGFLILLRVDTYAEII